MSKASRLKGRRGCFVTASKLPASFGIKPEGAELETRNSQGHMTLFSSPANPLARWYYANSVTRILTLSLTALFWVVFGSVSQSAPDMEVQARQAVRAALRDPDSAKFRDVRCGNSEETGPAVFGYVNSKNAFGGYSGFVKFVSNGTTTLIEGRDPRIGDAWRALCFAATTERTLAELPQSSQALPVKVDVSKLAGRTVNEVNALLGQPSSQEKIREGNNLIYQQKDVEVVFQNAKANLITISNLESIPFTPSAITSLGLPLSKPSFASDAVLRWKNVQGIAEISIFRGQQGCDGANIVVQQRK